jgi:hypothetical protein
LPRQQFGLELLGLKLLGLELLGRVGGLEG